MEAAKAQNCAVEPKEKKTLYKKGDIHDVKKLQTYSYFIGIFQNTREINV
jgi:hypothetical protein